MKRGFTLIELLVVIAIIGMLTLIVEASIAKSRSYGRDAQVRTDKETIELALARASAADPNDKYPGTAGLWYCLKATSGTCFGGVGIVDPTVNAALLPFMPGGTYNPPNSKPGTYPKPPLVNVGELRYDSYVYTPSNSALITGYTGPLILWWQEKPIVAADCNGYNAGQVNPGVYYCYDKLLK